jgi:transcriptional regulator with XRE-family HTH domain
MSIASRILQLLTLGIGVQKPVKSEFGSYLRELRRAAGLTLKQVETKAQVSNAYLSQIERGLRNPPHPEILKRLAAVYETPRADLLAKAGYLDEKEQGGPTRLEIESAYRHATSDPQFQYGTRLKGAAPSLDTKRFIVEMYEKLTRKTLLTKP